MPKLIPAKQAAKELGIPYTSLRTAAQRGLIPVVRMNRAWYFSQVALDEFVKNHTERLA